MKRADKNPLTVPQLRTYWNRIQRMEGMPGAALRIYLLSGGQRIEQIVRLKWADVDADSLKIFDGKGRPAHGPRPHQLPLVPALAKTLGGLDRDGEFVISHGLTGVQARHYEGHDYMPQKRQALELLFDLLESKPQPKVVPMKKHRA